MTMKKRKSTAFSTGFVMIVFYFGLFNLLLLPILAVEPDISGRHDKTLLTQEVAAIERCSTRDIVVYQGATGPLPNGIPTYTVEISNVSPNGISRIHLKCGWFSSARLINPKIFKRIRFDDCLVNNGMPPLSGRTISFRYATTFPYQLSVKEVYCA